jgi:hypothetical protein
MELETELLKNKGKLYTKNRIVSVQIMDAETDIYECDFEEDAVKINTDGNAWIILTRQNLKHLHKLIGKAEIIYEKKQQKMEDWKKSLDKHLTTEPNDGFDNWCEEVTDCFSDKFYDLNEEWIFETNKQCSKWLEKHFIEGKSPSEAAQQIEKDFEQLKKK